MHPDTIPMATAHRILIGDISSQGPDTTNIYNQGAWSQVYHPGGEPTGTEALLRAEASQVFEQKPPLGQYFVNLVLQVAGIIAAVAFGVYAIKSVRVRIEANGYAWEANSHTTQANDFASKTLDLSKMSNQLTLFALCLDRNNMVCKGALYITEQFGNHFFLAM